MRLPTSSEHACPTSGLLCGRLLVALVESVLRPGGWENMCRLMCHCVRHIGLDNKHGRSIEAIHSFLSRWKACTELCAGTQEEPCGKKSSLGMYVAIILFDQDQKRKGQPTSDEMQNEELLRRAWDAEGSPFRGTPYDPSKVSLSQGGSET